MKKLKKHIFTHANNIVIGGDVASFLFAFKHDYWITFTEPKPPFLFDRFSTGETKEEIWTFLFHQMMFRGKILGVYPNQSIRREGNIIKIITNENSLLNYQCDNVFCFDPTMLTGVPPTETKDRTHRVIHKLRLYSTPHELEYHFNGDDFIRELFFCTVRGTQKFIYSSSVLKESQMNDFDHSEVILRYKLLPILKSLGIKGANNGNNKKLSLKVEPIERFVIPLEHHEYEDEQIIFLELDEDKLWSSQVSSHIKKWSESSRWMDSRMIGDCRTLLTSPQ